MVDALIVVGAPNSSNSQRLREVAEREGCPIVGAGAARQRSRLVAVRGHQEPRHHRGRFGAGSDRRRDHGRLRRALRIACGDGLGRGRERVLPAAAFAAARRRESSRAWRFTPTSPPTSSRNFLTDYDIGELLSYKGIAEGVENSNFLLHTTHGLLHPDAVRKARGAGRSAVLPRPDGASRRPRASSARSRSRTASGKALRQLAGRPAAIINFPGRRLAAQAQRRALRRRRAGAGQDASRRSRLSGMTRANALSVSGWRPLFDAAARAPMKWQHGLARHDRRATERSSEAASGRKHLPRRRHSRRSVSGQCVLSRRQGLRHHRFLSSPATTCWPTTSGDLPQRLVFRDRR